LRRSHAAQCAKSPFQNRLREFQQRWRAVKCAWNESVGATQFQELCERFHDSYPSFITELRKKRDHYLRFLKYPDAIRRSLSTTNAVEAVNGQLEIIRRNSGGYFQSDDVLKLNLESPLQRLKTAVGPKSWARSKNASINSTRCFKSDSNRGAIHALRHNIIDKRPP
jgi:transposase-like protein